MRFKTDAGGWKDVSNDSSIRLDTGMEAAFDLGSGGNWYGHGFAHEQPYPLEKGSVANPAFAVNNIQSPIWMCSSGWAVFSRSPGRFSVSVNQGGDGLLKVSPLEGAAELELLSGSNLPDAWSRMAAKLGWPNNPPSPEFFGDSVFCTWTQYPRAITQGRILDMAHQIRAEGYPCRTITIDDRWESCFGELRFSKDFPDPKAMIDELHSLGFKVLLWTTPFVNVEAESHAKLAASKALVPKKDGSGAALMKWWGGTAGLLDLTNPEGRGWYKSQLRRLMNDYAVDGFKIDGGDAKYQPDIAESAWHEYKGASGYLDVLLSVFEETVPNICESRTAWMSQGRDILWRQGGKDSHWGLDNGLKAMVTLAMHMALMGYDILMPDMIPGRVQTLKSDMPLPTDELMLRWTEASAFMPLMQFSYFPWNYCRKTADAVLSFARMHSLLQEYLAAESKDRKAPLTRPLWFDHPQHESYFTIADQFMLGSGIVVAPVLDPEARCRDLALPPGEWRDIRSGKLFKGPVELKGFPAPCPGIPVFVKSSLDSLFRSLHEEMSRLEGIEIGSCITSTTFECGLDRDISVTG